MEDTQLKVHTIKEAIEDIKAGKIVIVVDDEERENEGDFICAAEKITPEIINFMSTYGRGLICTPLPDERCEELDLHLMVGKNTDPKNTAFTVSIDLIGEGVTTGISASDRAKTILALMDEKTTSNDFARPGHIFPLRAQEGGVLKRAGHTEAAVDLAELAGLKPGGVIVEIMNEDGSMSRLPELLALGQKHDIKIITIKDLIAYRLQHDSLVEEIDRFLVDTHYGNYEMIVFQELPNEQIHYALKKGDWTEDENVMVRVQSSNSYYDFFRSITEGEKPLLSRITDQINTKGSGVIVFINNHSDSDLALGKVRHFKKFIEGKSQSPTLPMDDKQHGIGAQILKKLGISNIELLSTQSNPNTFFENYGLNTEKVIKI